MNWSSACPAAATWPGTGKATKLKISIAGSGDVRFAEMQADEVRVSIAGSGDAAVNAQKSLDVSIAGSGDVSYVGNPSVKSSGGGQRQRHQALNTRADGARALIQAGWAAATMPHCVTSAPHARVWQHPEFARGAREMAGIAMGIAAWGLVAGVAMGKSGLPLPLMVFMSLTVFAGSAQLAAAA
jgi:hypothetical protein